MLTKMPDINLSLSLSEICGLILERNSFLILTHTRPDADTLGSAFALRELLRINGKSAEVINDDDIPKRLRFITEEKDSIRAETLPEGFEPELILSVDVSASKLLGTYEERYLDKIELAIDHHVLGTPFAPVTYVGETGACGELIVDLADELESRGLNGLNKAAATYLWAAICSDTGSFKFESVTSKTHIRIAKLLSCGINHAEIARRLYDSKPLSQVMGTKVALNNLHFYAENKLAVINFTRQMRVDNGLSREDIDDIIALTRSIEGVEVGMTIKQSDDDPTLFKVSMRSNRVADVSKLCALFEGGGHKRAAGCTLHADNEFAAEAKLVSAITDELRRLEAEGAFEGAGEL